MIETTLAAADLVNAVPSLWESIKVPAAVLLIMVGVGSAIVSLHKGIGTAFGKLIGGVALAALTLGAVGLVVSVKTTVDRHSGGVLTGTYSQYGS